jgi:crotonobetainyl-CoA:carnitine CoA-transferase CaiB-like acyl-CoA transferase
MTAVPASTPLNGVRILDFGHIVAAPFCGRILADLGADVVKVETSLRKDFAGGARSRLSGNGRPPAYLTMNRNKRSLTVNLKTDGGQKLIARLAAVADVLVENFSTGVMDRLGLGYDRLQAVNTRLIYVSMSGYGHKGPRRGWRSMNLNLQAYSGLMMATGNEGDPPVAISNSWNDFVGGLHACFGIVQALHERKRTGSGVYLDLSQFECSVASIGPLLYAASLDRRAPYRTGNRSASAAPQGCYRCAGEDSWCAISVQSDEQWRALVKVMGNPLWAADSKLETVAGRLRCHDEIDARIEQWTSQRVNSELEAMLQSAGIPAERVRHIDGVVEHSGNQGVLRTMAVSRSATVVAGVPFSFGRSALASFKPAPSLGEHNDEVLREWIGASDREITELKDQNVLQ